MLFLEFQERLKFQWTFITLGPLESDITISFCLEVRNILQRIAEHGWMGPEWAALDKVIRHSGQLVLHEFIRKCPIILKDAVRFIGSDEAYLKQAYRK